MTIPKHAKLIVELREDGKVYVTGPLANKDLCLAMLEEAKVAVNTYRKSLIVIPSVKINDVKN